MEIILFTEDGKPKIKIDNFTDDDDPDQNALLLLEVGALLYENATLSKQFYLEIERTLGKEVSYVILNRLNEIINALEVERAINISPIDEIPIVPPISINKNDRLV